jgi:hypothetical protein
VLGGSVVGTSVGTAVGTEVGTSVGVGVGTALGSSVGTGVVGVTVGAGVVGTAVGASVTADITSNENGLFPDTMSAMSRAAIADASNEPSGSSTIRRSTRIREVGKAVGADVVGTSVTGAALATLDCHVATNPGFTTLKSDVNSTNMLPDLAVTALGTLLPWNDPSTAPLLLVPS